MNRKQSTRTALVGVLAVLLVLASVPGLAAAKTSVGPTVVVDRGETLTDDLTTAGGTVLVLGTVDGDVTALAGDVVVSGEVTGDVTALAGRVEVDGTVGGKVTAFGGVTTVSGSVGDGIDAICGAVRLSGAVSGDVDAISVLVAVEEGGTVDGRLKTTAVSTEVNGTVSGTGGADVAQSRVGASLPSTLVSAGHDSPPDWRAVAGAPSVALTTITPNPLQILPFGISFLDAYGFFVNLLLGVVLVGVLPRFSTRVASRIVDDPVRTAAFGLAATVVVPIVLVLFGISLFGLPLALAGGGLMLVFWWVGAVYGRLAVGAWLIGSLPRVLAYVGVDVDTNENPWASLLVGVAVVWLLVAIPVVGPVFDTGVSLVGVGALVQLVYRTYVRTERVDNPVERAGSDAPESVAEN